MSATAWLGIGALGGVGALLRYAAELRLGPAQGTLVVNLLGAFLLGLLAGESPALTMGLLGALTTFSTWMLHATPRLIAVQLALGLAAAWLGDRLA